MSGLTLEFRASDFVFSDSFGLGVNAIILPGIKIGNHVVIGAGSVVTKNIESNSLAVGNPARVIKRIKTEKYGRIIDEISLL